MKIAFISYEYPPDTAYGGIATYVAQAAKMLQQRGHYIEVFTSSPHRTETSTENGILIHRIKEESRFTFPKVIGQVFAQRHLKVKFDIIEGPEYHADAQEAIRLCPEVPLAIKFHTPSFLLSELSGFKPPSLLTKIRVHIGALRRGKKPVKYWKQYSENYITEQTHAHEADELVMTCKAIGEKAIQCWGLNIDKVSYVPYPYQPSKTLLNIPINTNNTGIITFIGRLEIRKGVLDLAQAIPLILEKYPDTKFRFVGRPLFSPQKNLNMREYLEQMLKPYQASIQFTGPVPLEKISSVLYDTQVCVFPSLWENFPLVCLEAMAAGRAIVGSNAGGMTEQLNYGQAGRLVPPASPKDIAAAIIELLGDSTLCMSLGKSARERLVTEYSIERIGALQEASYTRAIKRRQVLGTRNFEK